MNQSPQNPQNIQNSENSFCSLCENEFEADIPRIKFECGHILCIPCSPYLILKALEARLISSSSFLSNYFEALCIICHEVSSKTQIIINSLLNNEFQHKQAPVASAMCEYCEKIPRSFYCVDCEQSFCRYCLDCHHSPNKKWSFHEIHEESNEDPYLKFLCKCTNGQDMDKFCLECGRGFCQKCKYLHNNHRFASMADLYKEKETVNSETQNQMFFSRCAEELHKLETVIKEQKKEYQDFLDNTIATLVKMKDISEQEFLAIKTQLKWYQGSFCYLIEEIDKCNNQILYPNKLFHIIRFFALKSKKPENYDLQKIRLQIIENPYYIRSFRENYQKIFSTIKPNIPIKEEHHQEVLVRKPISVKQEEEFSDKKIERFSKKKII